VKPLFGIKSDQTWVKYGLAALILRKHIYIRLLLYEGKLYLHFITAYVCYCLFFQYANNNNVDKSIETLAVLFTPVTFFEN